MPNDPSLQEEWEILRFSGWTKEGSKRTIKICSKESLENASSTCTSSSLGLLSCKARRFIACYDPENGPRLYIKQPINVPATSDLHILCDFDFLLDTAPKKRLSDTTTPFTVRPGVSSDLFLTSLCLFEREPGFTASAKAALLRKWQRLSGASKPLDLIPCLYRTEAFSSNYRSNLQAEIANVMDLEVSDTVSTTGVLIQETIGNLAFRYTPPILVKSIQKSPMDIAI